MVDLSTLKTRQSTQDRLTTRRDAVLPARRDTDAPRRETNADMRSARRGSNADEIMRTLGVLQDGVGELSSYIQGKRDARDTATVAQQMAVGAVDPELLKRSEAARQAYSLGNSQKQFFEFSGKLGQEVEALVNDPNNQVDEQDVDELIQSRVKEFAFDGDKPRDWGTPEANLKVAQMIQETSIKLRSGSAKAIREQVLERGVQTSAFNLSAGLRDGKPLDFEGAFRTLIPGTDLAAAKKSLINAVDEYSASVIETNPDRAVSVYDELLASKRADGTSSLSATEREQIRESRRQAAREVEVAKDRAEQKVYEANADSLLDRFNFVPGAGSYPTIAELTALRKDNKISAEFTGAMISRIRADREMNGSGTVSLSRGGGSRSGGDEELPPHGNDIISRVYSGKLTAGAAWSEALRAAQRGAFGSGTKSYKTLSTLRKNLGMVQSLEKGAMEPTVNRIDAWVAGVNERVRRSVRGEDRQRRAMYEAAQVANRVKVRVGEHLHRGGAGDPSAIADQGLRAATDVLISKYKIN